MGPLRQSLSVDLGGELGQGTPSSWTDTPLTLVSRAHPRLPPQHLVPQPSFGPENADHPLSQPSAPDSCRVGLGPRGGSFVYAPDRPKSPAAAGLCVCLAWAPSSLVSVPTGVQGSGPSWCPCGPATPSPGLACVAVRSQLGESSHPLPFTSLGWLLASSPSSTEADPHFLNPHQPPTHQARKGPAQPPKPRPWSEGLVGRAVAGGGV